MARVTKRWIMSPTTEIVIMSLVGMAFTVMEESFRDVESYLEQVWGLPLPRSHFSDDLQYMIKSILSYVVLTRSFTVHLYFCAYALVTYVAFIEAKPRLLLPWLLIGFVRNIVVDTATICTGGFICSWYGQFTPICVEFMVMKTVQLALSVYMWKSVYMMYIDLSMDDTTYYTLEDSKKQLFELAVRRRKVKSLADENELRRRLAVSQEENMLHVTVSDDDEFVFERSKCFKIIGTLSLDTLMSQLDYDPDMIELLAGRRNDEVEYGEEESKLSLAEKARRFLRMSADDVRVCIADRAARLGRIAQVNMSTQVNTLSKKFMKKTKRSVVDVATQVNTLSRKWLEQASSSHDAVPKTLSKNISGEKKLLSNAGGGKDGGKVAHSGDKVKTINPKVQTSLTAKNASNATMKIPNAPKVPSPSLSSREKLLLLNRSNAKETFVKSGIVKDKPTTVSSNLAKKVTPATLNKSFSMTQGVRNTPTASVKTH